MREDERGADCAIVFDSGMEDVHTPAITIGLRGVVAAALTVTAQPRDLHSGMYGGGDAERHARAAPASSAPSLPGPDGVLRDELREGIVPPSAAELESWARAAAVARLALEEIGARPVAPGAGDAWRERTGADASLDVNMLVDGGARADDRPGAGAGVPDAAPGARPGSRADARRARRAAARRAPGRRRARRDVHARRAVADRRGSAGGASRARGDRAGDRDDLRARALGGSIPVVAAMAARGWPVIVSGFGTAEDEIHAPNESYRLESLDLGERAGARLLRALAALPQRLTRDPWPAPHG